MSEPQNQPEQDRQEPTRQSPYTYEVPPVSPAPAYPYAQAPMAPYGPPVTAPKNWAGIVALIVGIVALCFCLTFFLGPAVGGPLSIVAIVFGAIGRSKVKHGEATNKTMTTWGLWLGIVAASVALVELIIWIALIAAAGNAATTVGNTACDQAISRALNNPNDQAAQDAVTTTCD
jgi:hypothetical protein